MIEGSGGRGMKIEKKTTTATPLSNQSRRVERSQGAQASDDSVELSPSGSLLPRALEVLASAPDIRNEAVEPIRKELADGNYHRDEVLVAEKVIEDHLASPG